MVRSLTVCSSLLLVACPLWAQPAVPLPTPIGPGPTPTHTPVTASNGELVELWRKLLPDLEDFVVAQVRSQLAGRTERFGPMTVEVLGIQQTVVDMQQPPGFGGISTQQLMLRAPRTGHWAIDVTVDAKVTLNLGFTSSQQTMPVTVRMQDMSVEVDLQLDDSDPGHIKVQRSSTVRADFQVKVSAPGMLGGILARALEPTANRVLRSAVDQALAGVGQDLADQTATLHGANSPRLVDNGVATPFAQVAHTVDAKILAHHLPHGILSLGVSTQPLHDHSWLQAYGPGGSGFGGAPRAAIMHGDSAIWTGHFLAAQALRHSVLADPASEASARAALRGIDKLLAINGNTGLLARQAAPLSSPQGQAIDRGGAYARRTLGGVTWVGSQGHNGISRDQYSGVVLGLALTWEHVPALRSECQRLLTLILDYLVGHGWYIDEDRKTLANGGNPTPWTFITYQKLAFLHVGERVVPGRYAAELTKQSAQAGAAWMGLWVSTFSLESYYKFNLSHIGLYNVFRLESDPQRWQDIARGNRLIRRATGNHHNPHFDLIQASIEPALRPDNFSSARQALRRFLQANHRNVAPPVIDLTGVTWVNTTAVGSTGSTSAVRYSTEPIDVTKRPPTGNFTWQRNPFLAATPNQGNARVEKPGIDYVLPYWMGRAMGAF